MSLALGIHQWLVNSPYKWPVMLKMFPLVDIIMDTWLLMWHHCKVFYTWDCNILTDNQAMDISLNVVSLKQLRNNNLQDWCSCVWPKSPCLSSITPWLPGSQALLPHLLGSLSIWDHWLDFGEGSWLIQTADVTCYMCNVFSHWLTSSGLILGLHPTNVRHHYKVMLSFIGWVQT